ncbi:MAG: class I SAM-dependent methyltransferase [Tepidisphaeraceae bacterium]
MSDLNPIAPRCTPCKCCGQPAKIFGVVDFFQACTAERPDPKLGWSGIPIYYHSCPSCGFLFTTAFDQFSPADLKRWVYNDQYAQIDPDYFEIRPEKNVNTVMSYFAPFAQTLRVLDYGGGNGALARKLREHGFTNVESYDPIVPEFSQKPHGQFDLVFCFEVLEHTTNPAGIFDDMAHFIKPDGMAVFTTLVLPAHFQQIGLRWFYIAPRNGHISIFSVESLRILATKRDLRYFPNENTHSVFRTVPPFARHIFGDDPR